MGALHGLDIAWGKGFLRVYMEIVSEMVVRWLRSDGVPRLSLANLIERCKRLLSRQWEVKIMHAFRECNRVADVLATEALGFQRGLHMVKVIPVQGTTG